MNEFKRQSKIGVLYLFLNDIKDKGKRIFAILALIGYKYRDTPYLYISFAVLVITLFIFNYIKYINFKFKINEEKQEVELKSGVFSKSHLKIPLKNIQQIELNQDFFHRILNIYELKIDTSGSEKVEFKIRALNGKDAQNLKQKLSKKYNFSNDLSVSLEEVESIKISMMDIFKFSIFQNHFRTFVLIVGILFSFFQKIFDFNGTEVETNKYLKIFKNTQFSEYEIIIALILAVFITIVGTLIYNLIKYYALRFQLKKNNIEIYFGLFETHQKNITKLKIQLISLKYNLLQKTFGYNQLSLQQIGGKKKQNKFNFIALNNEKTNKIISFIYPFDTNNLTLIQPNIRLFTSKILVLLGIIFLASSFIYITYQPSILLSIGILVLFLGLIILYQYLYYKNYRYSYSKNSIEKQKGLLEIERKIIKVQNIQSIQLKQYIWQKRRKLGTINFNTAGGFISFKVIKWNTVNKLVNYFLYQIEKEKEK